ncbi:uncharacterized protein LOC127712647 isoform X5 [Mytilus californianus]|uniref:uncharacterized protein LOC127712647 isoform X5 n=1 Tax=Mytilus californianus TaxID=6549 RepID=UPI002245C60C|nr:uncharacterized protein LOC127712647 isoform X5 [Mytilus californianus]
MESILKTSCSEKVNSRAISPLRRCESSLARIFPNMSEMLSREDRNQLSRLNKAKRQRLRPNQTVSIDSSPMMMLPKARIRNDYNQLNRRKMSVISADDTSGLHLSTISGSAIVSKSFSKSSLRNHHHSSRSDVDSGIGSMRRSVTFDEISFGRSSFKSIDDIDAISDFDQQESKERDDHIYEPFPEGRYNEMPQYVDTYSDNQFTPPKFSKKKKQKRVVPATNPDTEENHEANCPICSGFNNQTARMQKYFGGVDEFFKWFWSRWGKGPEKNNFQRRNYGFQGYRPRFCNIVKSMQLHSREGRDMSPCTGDSGFDEFDYFTKDGRMINRWRKESTTSKANRHTRNALDMWLSLGEDEYGNRVNFRPNYMFGLFSSIPEHPEVKQDDLSTIPEDSEFIRDVLSKGAGSGLDGKPGTPTSINEDLDRMDLTNLNIVYKYIRQKKIKGLQDDDDDLLKKKRTIHTLTIPDDSTYRNTDDDNRASESPTQPPPSPNISFSKETVKPPSPPKKKAPVTKKTLEKKPFNKKKKEDMEKTVEEPPPPREPTPPPPPVEEKKEPEIVVNLPEPTLPEFKEPGPKQKKEKNKPEKFAIPKTEKPKIEDDSLFSDALTDHLKKFELMVSDMTSPEESPKKHTNKPVKITGRLALSQQSSRFTLPMDMKELETMTPKQYIVKYCKITKRRQHLYDNVYRQTVGAVTKPMHYKELEKALKNVLVDTLNHEHYQYICELLEIKEGEDINSDLFAKMSALAERLLYPQYVTKETEDHKDYQKELIEVADFSALEWKFHGVNVRPDIQKLLKTLC